MNTERCRAITKKGTQCTRRAQYNGYCGRHAKQPLWRKCITKAKLIPSTLIGIIGGIISNLLTPLVKEFFEKIFRLAKCLVELKYKSIIFVIVTGTATTIVIFYYLPNYVTPQRIKLEEFIVFEDGRQWLNYSFGPSSNYLTSLSDYEGSIIVWEISSKSLIYKHSFRHGGIICSPNARYYAIKTSSYDINRYPDIPYYGGWISYKFYDVFDVSENIKLCESKNIYSESFSTNSRYLAWVDGKYYNLIDLVDNKTIKGKLPHHEFYPEYLVPSPAGNWLIGCRSGSRGNQDVGVNIFKADPISTDSTNEIALNSTPIRRMSFSPDGQWLIIVNYGIIRLIELNKQKEYELLSWDDESKFDFSKDGQFLVYWTKRENTYKVWDLAKKQE